jgi:hypothetical protein
MLFIGQIDRNRDKPVGLLKKLKIVEECFCLSREGFEPPFSADETNELPLLHLEYSSELLNLFI